jgi:hypothetical protein
MEVVNSESIHHRKERKKERKKERQTERKNEIHIPCKDLKFTDFGLIRGELQSRSVPYRKGQSKALQFAIMYSLWVTPGQKGGVCLGEMYGFNAIPAECICTSF